MNIILVYKEDYPWDVRVEKIALALIEQGHSVTIVSRNLKQRPVLETIDTLKLRRMPRFKLLPFFLRKLLNLPLWFSPIWILTIFRAVREEEGDLIIIRDLPLVKSALVLKRFLGTKVILDMAEVYPEMYASTALLSDTSLAQILLKNPKVAERYESAILPKLDHILVMIEESRDRLLRKSIGERRITIVSNTPPIDKFHGVVHKHTGTHLRLVYVGFITELRGLDLLVKAVAKYIEMGNSADTIKVDIVGKGASKLKLERLVNKLGIANSVTIHGWLSHERVNELMAEANVGTLTYRVCGHWNHTIPNKIFDYMLAGLPVLATDVAPIKRIVLQENCGLICQDLDVTDIAENLERLRDPELRQLLGDNGHQAVCHTWNWYRDKKLLSTAINTLFKKN